MRWLFFGLFAGALVGACHLVSGVHELEYVDATGAGGATTSASSSATNGGAAGFADLGTPCDAPDECESGACVDEVCCENACEGACASCALAGNEGICSPQPLGSDPDAECNGGSCGPQGSCVGAQLEWGKAIGDVTIHDVAVDSSGAVYVAGEFSGSVSLGGATLIAAGPRDIVVARFTDSGSHAWSRSFGASEFDAAYGIAVDGAGSVWITGVMGSVVNFGNGLIGNASNGSDMFLVELNANSGATIASGAHGGMNQESGWDVEATDDGIYVVGTHGAYPGFIAPNPAYQGLFLAKFTTAGGSPEWARSIIGEMSTDAELHGAQRLAVSAGVGCAITGGFQGSLDFTGGTLQAAQSGQTDDYLALFDANGNEMWSTSFSTVNLGIAARDVAIDGAGNVYATGLFSGSADFGDGPVTPAGSTDLYVAAFDGGGSPIWSHTFGDGTKQEAHAIALSDGVLALSGLLAGSVDLGGGNLSPKGEDAFLLELAASDGTHLFSAVYGDSNAQQGTALAMRGSDVVVAGRCSGTIDFGGGPIACGPAAVLAKFTP